MIVFDFTEYGLKCLQKLPKDVQGRIEKKLSSLKNHPNIFTVISALEDVEPATHRLRVGDYRLVLQLTSNTKSKVYFMVIDVDHRKNIYRNM